jgi:ribosomal protein S18 acetylase RimI-like enzyme
VFWRCPGRPRTKDRLDSLVLHLNRTVDNVLEIVNNPRHSLWHKKLSRMENLELTLRPATAADEPFLFDLRRSAMDEHLERAGEPTDESVHWARLRYCYNDAYLVCCGAERLGFFKFIRDANEWKIVQIQILPIYQGRGIAAQLIGEFLQQADDAHAAVTLSVLKGNRAINLYQRLGFQVVVTTSTSLQMKRGRPGKCRRSPW